MSTTSAVYDVPGISCGHCQQTIEGALQAVNSVESVSVDVAGKRVTIVGNVTSETVRVVLDDVGYSVAGTLRS